MSNLLEINRLKEIFESCSTFVEDEEAWLSPINLGEKK